jgi:pentachlorophenol monooxygenase/3-(3-hydroxy-phenyl)propionate hydroxylase
MAQLGAHDELATVLGARPGEVWLVRPDSHLAAIVPAGEGASLRQAIARLLG